MKFDDALLSQSARIVRDRQLARLPDLSECPEHIFSDDFEAKMEALLKKVRNDEIKEEVAPLGYRYYIRRSIAAVLIAFLLTCVAAPEAVMAGYKRIVEAIRTIVTEYTEWQYTSSDDTVDEFKQPIFNYLPPDLTVEDIYINSKNYFVFYTNGVEYFNYEQNFINDNHDTVYLVDTEDANSESTYINGEKITLYYNKEMHRYIWIHDHYLIRGQSNLSTDEIVKILENITFE